MKSKRKKLTQKRLKELFVCVDGNLIRKKAVRGYGCKNGCVAGTLSCGYYRICVDRIIYLRSHLVWLYYNGYFPENIIDHIDRVSTNDKIKNLREASQSCNIRNTGNWGHNSSGVKGVYWDKKYNKWRSLLCFNNKSHFLGLYEEFDDAVCARLAGEQCLNWSGCDSSSPAHKHVERIIKSKL